ncbi:MAG TPA: macro domain-containing protein [Polyangiales bacterium]|nr:macro domain-containing protein [Polyangiales bacterium]
MPTALVKGDIFETPGIRAYAFGANTDGTMDAGISIAMKKRWPELAEAFAARCAGDKLNLGDVFVWTQGDVTVFALGIQQGAKKPSMTALTHAIRRMLTLANEAKIGRVGIPRIGAGPSGLDWTRVRKMLAEISVGQPVRLDVFEQFVRAKE